MKSGSWTLTDVANCIHQNDFTLAADVGSTTSWRITQKTLRGGLSDGVDLIEIDNGRMSLFVLPTRGMGIWKATIGSETLGWKSPVRGPVHPKFVPISESSGLGWLDGFDELVVRCGLESNGAPEFNDQGRLLYPLHGRIANRPAHFVRITIDDEQQQIAIEGLVEESRFHFQKLRLETRITTAFNSQRFEISDCVENFGGNNAEMQLLYHINIGEPLIGAGAKIVVGSANVTTGIEMADASDGWNDIGSPTAGSGEEGYFLSYPATSTQPKVLLKNASESAGVAVAFATSQLPYFTVWKNPVASVDGYVVGLEPATNYPNKRSSEKASGRVVTLSPGQRWSANVAVDWLRTSDEVAAVEREVMD